MYKINDISVVIPTYNRVEDLRITLETLAPLSKKLNEVIIVDQSNNNLTKNLIKKISKRYKNIRYIFSSTPAITIARNLGLKNSDKNSKIICFIDDDVTIKEDYFKEIIRVFNEYKQAKAAAVYIKEDISLFKRLNDFENMIRKFFFLQYAEKNKARIISAFGNTYPKDLKRVINSQWLQGANMVYKKEVFREQMFDENLLGYTIAEDTDFSYRLYKKYTDSIFITPFANITHRYSQIERHPTEKMAMINQIDHFYFNFKNLNKNIFQQLVFIWANIGILKLRFLNLLRKRNKIEALKFKFYLKSLVYCVLNMNKIKKGRLREFEKK
jgi:GT2 family glycosyltransferase